MARPRRSRRTTAAPRAPQPTPGPLAAPDSRSSSPAPRASPPTPAAVEYVNISDEEEEDDDIEVLAVVPPPQANPPPVESDDDDVVVVGTVVHIEPDLSDAELVCTRPRIIRNTVDTDTLGENRLGAHLKYVRDAVFERGSLMLAHLREPNTPVVAFSLAKPCETVTYLYNLDHDSHPILGRAEKKEYGDKYLFGPQPVSEAEQLQREKNLKEREKADAKIQAEREAKKKLRRGPCTSRGCHGRKGH